MAPKTSACPSHPITYPYVSCRGVRESQMVFRIKCSNFLGPTHAQIQIWDEKLNSPQKYAKYSWDPQKGNYRTLKLRLCFRLPQNRKSRNFRVVVRRFPVAPAPATCTKMLGRSFSIGKIFMGPRNPLMGTFRTLKLRLCFRLPQNRKSHGKSRNFCNFMETPFPSVPVEFGAHGTNQNLWANLGTHVPF